MAVSCAAKKPTRKAFATLSLLAGIMNFVGYSDHRKPKFIDQEEQILSVGRTYWNETELAPEREKIAVDCMGFLFLSYRVSFNFELSVHIND